MAVDPLLAQIEGCTLCADELEPRPVLTAAPGARVVIVGQAPGAKVHASGRPWDDASGDHLRSWLGVDRATFEDPRRFAIVPMAFCFPGRRKGGDKPPPARCAATWHAPVLDLIGGDPLVLLVGQYAQRAYLGTARARTLTETVAAWRRHGPDRWPLPHPSWRSKLWMAKHPWFEAELLPALRERVAAAIDGVEG